MVRTFAWHTFLRTTEIANRLGLRGAGNDLLSDLVSGPLRGMGPGYAELEFIERPSEPVLCFLADKTEPGAWNLPLYKMRPPPGEADHLRHPRELSEMLMFIGTPGHYVVRGVLSKSMDIQAAATSTQRLSLIAGKHTGTDDPVMIVRCQSGLPTVGAALEPFASASLVPVRRTG